MVARVLAGALSKERYYTLQDSSLKQNQPGLLTSTLTLSSNILCTAGILAVVGSLSWPGIPGSLNNLNNTNTNKITLDGPPLK